MASFDLHLVDFFLHRLTIYRQKRSLKPEHFKSWKGRYDFDLIFGKKDTALYSLAHGLQMHFFKSNKLCFEIFKGFEEDEIDFLNRFLKPGDIFVDVGANMGLFSLYASRKVNPGGLVFAFEPSSLTSSRLRDNLLLNKLENVTIIEEGLSDKPGEQELIMAGDGYDAFNSFAKPSMGGIASSERVPVTTFDFFMESKGLKPSDLKLVKVDVEGWEYPVFKGGERTFSHPDAPTLIVEFTEQNARNAGYSCAMLSELLHEFGYNLFSYDKKSRNLTREGLGKTYGYQNLIAVKQERQLYHFSIK